MTASLNKRPLSAGALQARVGAVHVDVPAEGVPALVHRRGHGRHGVHRGRVQPQRPHLGVPAVSGEAIKSGMSATNFA